MLTRSSKETNAAPDHLADRLRVETTTDWALLCSIAKKYGVDIPTGGLATGRPARLQALILQHFQRHLPTAVRTRAPANQPAVAAPAVEEGDPQAAAVPQPQPTPLREESSPTPALCTPDASCPVSADTLAPCPCAQCHATLLLFQREQVARFAAERDRGAAVEALKEEERARRAAEAAYRAAQASLDALKAERAVADSQAVRLQIHVTEAPVQPAQAPQRAPLPTARTPPPAALPNASCTKAPSGASAAQAAAAPAQRRTAQAPRHHQPQRSQPPQQQPTQSGDRAWVFQGLPCAADCDVATATSAVRDFAAEHLSMPVAVQQALQVLRTSPRIDGLAIISVADSSAERELCRAKARLPPSCGVSIYRSLPPQQRAAAAKQRLAPQPWISAADAVAEARRAAAEAVAFAHDCLDAERRRQFQGGPHSPLSPTPLGVPSRFSVLPIEPTCVLSPAAHAWTPASNPPSTPTPPSQVLAC